MLPIAPSKPITAYNTATTSPPMNWLLDPAPAIRFCSKAESNFLPQLNTKRSEQRDERASVHPCDHSITSSARPESGSGMVMPSALAALRLRISSTFVENCTTGGQQASRL